MPLNSEFVANTVEVRFHSGADNHEMRWSPSLNKFQMWNAQKQLFEPTKIFIGNPNQLDKEATRSRFPDTNGTTTRCLRSVRSLNGL